MNLQLVYRYILSLSKNEHIFYEKTKQKTKGKKKQKGKKKRKKLPTARVEPTNLRHGRSTRFPPN